MTALVRVAGWAAAWVALGPAAGPAWAGPPLPARGTFVSRSYALTFTAPPDLFHCPVPDGWTGSDHGTVLFLRPPRLCGGAGYPSSARGFEPPGMPRVEVYYGRTNGIHATEPCRGAGRVRFLGRLRPLCAARRRGMITREVRGLYTADDETEAVLTLVTDPSRLRHDLAVFRALAAGVHPCAIPWQDAQGRTRIEGSGPRCPERGDFY